jgi:putative membrane protein
MMHWGSYGWNWGMGWGLGCFLVFIFWLLVILGVAFLVKSVVGSGKKGETTQESALDILKKRYARGEIGKEEFEEKKKDIL